MAAQQSVYGQFEMPALPQANQNPLQSYNQQAYAPQVVQQDPWQIAIQQRLAALRKKKPGAAGVPGAPVVPPVQGGGI